MPDPPDRHPHPASPAQPPTTNWTLIACLHSGDPQQVRRALEDLCAQYHYPLYCYIRRRGLDHHDAQDALHDFLAKLLRNDTFGAADPEKGRLRTFLLHALKLFLINWRRDQRHREHELSLDAEAALADDEARYRSEGFTDDDAPDRVFERQWAREMLARTMQTLREQYGAKEKAALFEALNPVLIAGGSLVGQDTDAIAASLGMRPGTLRTALLRLLGDFRAALKAAIAQTIDNPEEAKAEFRELARVFKR
jgi:RNA polymerase sigma-70 factor (ECF subfamily)